MIKLFPKRQIDGRNNRSDRIFIIRNILNILFILCALVGIVLYFFSNLETVGVVTILTAIFFKMAESSLRIFSK